MKSNVLHVVVCSVILFQSLVASALPGVWVGIELERGHRGGVLVRGVVPGSPAAGSNLTVGDEIVSVDGAAMHSPAELSRDIGARPAGKLIHLEVVNADGVGRDVALTPAPRPGESQLARQRLVGKPAPAFTLPVVNGKPAQTDGLAAHHGRAVLIDFWATWCGPCVRALPHITALRARWAARGLDVIGLSTEDPALLTTAIAQHGILHPVLDDPHEAAFRAYGILALPTLVLVDREGIVRDVEVGGDVDAIEALLPELLQPKPRAR